MDSSFERSAALVKEWLRFHGYTGALQQMERPPTIRSEDLALSDQGPDAWRQELVDKMVRLLAEGERERFWAQVSYRGSMMPIFSLMAGSSFRSHSTGN